LIVGDEAQLDLKITAMRPKALLAVFLLGAAMLGGCPEGTLDPRGPIASAERLLLFNSTEIMLVVASTFPNGSDPYKKLGDSSPIFASLARRGARCVDGTLIPEHPVDLAASCPNSTNPNTMKNGDQDDHSNFDTRTASNTEPRLCFHAGGNNSHVDHSADG